MLLRVAVTVRLANVILWKVILDRTVDLITPLRQVVFSLAVVRRDLYMLVM